VAVQWLRSRQKPAPGSNPGTAASYLPDTCMRA